MTYGYSGGGGGSSASNLPSGYRYKTVNEKLVIQKKVDTVWKDTLEIGSIRTDAVTATEALGGYKTLSADNEEHFAIRTAMADLQSQDSTSTIAVGSYNSGTADNYLVSNVDSTWRLAKAEVGNLKEDLQGSDWWNSVTKNTNDITLDPTLTQNMLVRGVEFDTPTALSKVPYDLNILDHSDRVIGTIQYSDVWDKTPQPADNPKYTVTSDGTKLRVIFPTYIPMSPTSGIKLRMRFKKSVNIRHDKLGAPIYKLLYNRLRVDGVRTFTTEPIPTHITKDDVYAVSKSSTSSLESRVSDAYEGSSFEVQDSRGTFSKGYPCVIKFEREKGDGYDVLKFSMESAGDHYRFFKINSGNSYTWWATDVKTSISSKLF